MSTYTPIASVTLSSAQSSVTFSGIPQTYTDLILVVNMATSSASGSDSRILVRINSDSSANYSTTYLTGDGSNAFSARDTNRVQIDGAVNISSSPNFGQVIYQFQNYTNTNIFKTILQRGSNLGNTSGIGTSAAVSLYRQTSAITSLNILTGGPTPGNFVSGSTFNLYGVANASITNVAKATGGDSVYTDGTYWYHIFRSSGTFTPTQALTADYLVVAGGGGAGTGNSGSGGGGGGAGGLRCTVTATGGGGSLESALSLTAQAYTVTVGAGGTGGSSPTNGSNSVFSSITSTGGGYGGGVGASGGSGGGGGGNDALAGGAGTANQGYAGGASASGSTVPAGGGGGAGAVGGAGDSNASNKGGAGGAGVATSITGSSVTYAGGGGGSSSSNAGGTGGAGGSGGGGAGATVNANGVSGTANTGGGGGGARAGAGYTPGSGGSGIVIVRYGV